MITSLGQYKRELAKFIREEEKGVGNYKKLIEAMPNTPEFDGVRKVLRNIGADEVKHVTYLKRLYYQR